MKNFSAVGLALAVLSAFAVHAQAAPEIGSEARASELIRLLQLHVLAKESGYLGIIGVSAQKVALSGRLLAVQSQNYYLLTRGRPINYLHRLISDDTHILIEGGRLTILSSIPTAAPKKSRSVGISPPTSARSSPFQGAAGRPFASMTVPTTH